MSEPDPEPDLVADPVADPVAESAAPVRRRRYPSTFGGTFYLGVLAASALAILVIVPYDWRVGVRVLAGALVGAGVLRLVLPQRAAGMLVVRRRSIDVVLLVAVGAALWWLAGSIPDQPTTTP